MKKSRKGSAYVWISFVILSLADFIVRFFRNSTGTLGASLASTFSVNEATLGNLSSLYFFPYMLMQIPTGYLADVLGVRLVVSLGMFATAFGAALFGLAPNLTVLFIARVIIGFGVSAPVVCIQRFISSAYDSTKQGRMSGIQSLMGSFGSVFAQAPLAFLLQYFTWRMTIVGVGIFTLALSVMAFIFIKDSPKQADPGALPRQYQPKKKKNIVKAFASIYGNRYTWPLLVILFLHMSINAVFASTYAVPYLIETFGLTNVQASSFTTIQAVGQMLGGIIAGPVSDKLGSRKKVMLVLSGLSMGTWIMFVFGTGLLAIPAVMVAVMFINGLVYYQTVMVFFCAKELNDPLYVGSSVSAVNMIGMLGSALAPNIAGNVMNYFAGQGVAGAGLYHNSFIIFMIAAMIMFVLTFFIKDSGCRNRYHELTGTTPE